jgi:hypothetical protein
MYIDIKNIEEDIIVYLNDKTRFFKLNGNIDTHRKFKLFLYEKYTTFYKNAIKHLLYKFGVCNNCGQHIEIENIVFDYSDINTNARKYRLINACRACKINYKNRREKWFNDDVRQKAIKSLKHYAQTEIGMKKHKNLGVYNSVKLKNHFNTTIGKKQIEDVKKLQSATMKIKIANGEFTPNITNTWTHWNAYIEKDNKQIKFRSSWEACFWLSNDHLKYEYKRIPYIDENGITRNYIVDFYDDKQNIAYEIKPTSYFIKQKHKLDQAINYCLKNSIKFIWINERNILQYVDKSKYIGENRKQLDQLLKGIKNEQHITKNKNFER